jgi:LPXTG-motif cell wall-anchored protein
MRRDLKLKINKMLASKAHRKTFLKVVSSLMAVVVFCTTYALILPALTLANDTYCGKEEHTHTDECYELRLLSDLALTCQPDTGADYIIHSHDSYCYDSQGELKCTLAEVEEHQHGEDCYDEEENLICDKTEIILHSHDEGCFDEEGQLICALPVVVSHQHDESCLEELGESTQLKEISMACPFTTTAEFVVHSHDEYCYDSNGELICTLTERVEHRHSPECYQEDKLIVCGMDGDASHTHSEECYDVVENLICGKPEIILHSHDESCYSQVQALTCNISDHQHSDECYREERVLVCGLEENEEHQHSEDCYESEPQVICGMEESSHQHDESCYETQEVLSCGMPYIVSHQHTEDCLNVTVTDRETENEEQGEYEKVLICDKEEHTHTAECYEEPEALEFSFEIEDQGISGTVSLPWDKSLPDDLECTVLVLQGDEEDYDAMYQAATESLDVPAGEISDISLYQLEWTSKGEAYELPEELTPTIKLNVENSDSQGDIEQISGIVLNTAEEAEQVEAKALQTQAEEAAAVANSQDYAEPEEEDDSEEDAIADDAEAESEETDAQAAEEADSKSIVANTMSYTGSASTGYVRIPTTTTSSNAKLMLLADEGDADEGTYYEDGDENTRNDVEERVESSTTDDNNYSGTVTDADENGDLELTMTGKTMAIAKSRKITSGAGYYKRIDSIDDMVDGGTYLIMFTNYQVLMASNKVSFDYADAGTASTWYDPLAVTVHEVRGSDGNLYYVFRDSSDGSYVGYKSGYLTYHWGFNAIDYSSSTWLNRTTDSGYYYAKDSLSSKFFRILNRGTGYYLWAGLKDTTYSYTLPDGTTTASYGRFTNAFGLIRATALKNAVGKEYSWRLYSRFYYEGDTYENYFMCNTFNMEYNTPTSGTNSVTYHQGKYIQSTGVPTQDRHYWDNIIIYQYMGTSITEVNDEEQAALQEKVEIQTDDNPNVYENDTDAISDKKTGVDSENLDELAASQVSYASDPATSLIKENYSFLSSDPENMKTEDLLLEQKANDGRVMTDKSVVYRADDYDAYDTDDYEQGDFSVTLSALGQEWSVQNEMDDTTPVDVVFILDTSSSMITVDSGTENYRWINSVNAINQIAKELMTRNSQNRIGLVAFASSVMEVLPLDRYSYNETTDDGEENKMPFLYYDTTTYESLEDSYRTLRVSDGVKGDRSGTISKKLAPTYTSDESYGQWAFTYTQLGYEKAYELFKDANSTTATVGGKTVTRQPVIILLSDGDPTLSSIDYMNPDGSAIYGAGSSKYQHGYYTVLSANYFKNMTSIFYGKVAYLYTIALGIEYESQYKTYSLAVMNPTEENINKITSSTYLPFKYLLSDEGQTGSYKYRIGTTFRNDSDGNAPTPQTYYRTGQTGYLNQFLATADTMNPYENYAYADQGYYGKMSEDKLETIMKSILTQVQPMKNYGFLLEDGTSLVFTDEVGEGMTVKGVPVLRYGGENIDSSLVKTTTGKTSDGRPYTEYSWNATGERVENSADKETEFSLSGIKARVYHTYTSADGKVSYTNEKVEFIIPEDVLPIYYPNLTQQFYYESEPVRLIYKVGLSDETLKSIADSPNEIQDQVYYTSLYDADDEDNCSTTVTFTPAVTDPKTGKAITSSTIGSSAKVMTNPYYTATNLATVVNTINKSVEDEDAGTENDNVSGTYSYSFDQSVSTSTSGYTTVTQKLGNNGKLTIYREAPGTVTVNKEWATPGSETDSVTVRLYASGKVQTVGETTTKSGVWCLGEKTLKASDDDDKNWTDIFTNLPDEETIGNYTYTYENFYVREVKLGEDGEFVTSYKDKDDKDIDTTTLTLTKKADIDSAFLKKYPMKDNAETVDAAIANSGEVTVVNAKNYSLPHTGGTGTELYYVAGFMLMLCSGAVLTSRKLRRHF